MLEDKAVLTAAQMVAAERAIAPDEEALYQLMERAGAGVADFVRRISAGAEVLVACGPGNNGGDGYVAARILRGQNIPVRVVSVGSPRTPLSQRARATWEGEVEDLLGEDPIRPAPVFVDAVFGVGQKRRIERDILEPLLSLAEAARVCIAVDLPSGIATDDGGYFVSHSLPIYHTLAIGALKPAHILPNATNTCGEVRLVEIGLSRVPSAVRTIARPNPPRPVNDTHKYSRGMVGVIAGEMPGAALLAATAAARAGAGYVVIYGDVEGGPASIVRRPLTDEALSDERLDVVLIGPGLGRSDAARSRIDWLLTKRKLLPVVLDADALHLFDPESIGSRGAPVALTPHGGEYYALHKRLGTLAADELDFFSGKSAKCRALSPGGAPPVVVEKGSTTYVVSGDEIRVAPRGNPWLSTAGTGDVLAGTIATMVAAYFKQGKSMVDAAAAGVWLHMEAARRLKASFIADDLAAELSAVRASL